MIDNELPYNEIIGLMKVGYNQLGIIPFDLINQMANYLVTIHVRTDKEFKELLGDEYYT